ncbi:MAG TPA: N-acetylglucosamine-6-phosphate deacetylase [Gemmataceae bacterium]|jgi:N-acetylglucosamine-6-phosphate deacetylase|nr:N-acetylglucosamine-6-phosphate deacetylase [Gemmataceae bacterium]
MFRFLNGVIVLPDQLLRDGEVVTLDDRIADVGPAVSGSCAGLSLVDLEGGYLLPGFIDLHVHGGAGADFMDGTAEAFRTVLAAHACHGTTSCTPTTTVARHDQHIKFLELVRTFRGRSGPRVLGAHIYGPYFAPEARGCHPANSVRNPTREDFEPYLAFAEHIRTATVAPELAGAEEFVRACRAKGVRCNAGHSHATFEQVEAAIGWGVTHIDHLFCAMSDRARLRQAQTYPMRGGVMEATLFFDQLTTEVIADGQHLAPSLLKLAYKAKGPDRLALVTDAMRALDRPDGEHIFGPLDGGEPVRRMGDVGVTLDGKALASGVMGMDHCLRTFIAATGVPIPEAVRMATLTPARIVGVDNEIGSIAVGKKADLVVTDAALNVRRVFVAGRPFVD